MKIKDGILLMVAFTLMVCTEIVQGAGFRNYVSEDEADSSEHGQAAASSTTSCPCGWTNKARVVGGKETQKNEYPLMLGLINVEEAMVFCGASIVTRRHGLTAAHCTQPVKGEQLQVVAGGHDLLSGGDHDVLVDVQETIEHEKYSTSTFENDIALLILAEPLEYNQYIGPVCMPSQRYDLVNNYIKLLGWGKTSTRGAESDVLLKVNLRVVPLKECYNTYKSTHIIDLVKTKQICTFRRGKDSCQGDSGGPLIWLDESTNRYTQVALVSYGRECASNDPAVNTDVFSYIDWIKLKIKESNLGQEVCEKV